VVEQRIKLNRIDWFVLVLCVAFIISLYVRFWKADESAQQVEILVQGEKQYILDLKQDRKITVQGKQGESLIEIKDGKARFISSSCNTSFCVRNGWQQHGGDFVACLPNAVSLHLAGGSKLYDAINF